MRHTSRKRQSPDPLASIPEPAWLVVRDDHGNILESAELAPNSNLRTVLMAARRRRIDEGWTAQEIGTHCAFFLACREAERVLVGIERRAPLGRGACYLDR